MSLGHKEPITQKHTLQKHPREESSGLDLKALGFRKSCKQQGISVRTGWRAGTGAGMRPHAWPRAGATSMVEGAKARFWRRTASACQPHPPALVHSLGTKLKHLQLYEAFSSHQSLLHPSANWKSWGGILLDQYQMGVRGERVELPHVSDSDSTSLAQRPPRRIIVQLSAALTCLLVCRVLAPSASHLSAPLSSQFFLEARSKSTCTQTLVLGSAGQTISFLIFLCIKTVAAALQLVSPRAKRNNADDSPGWGEGSKYKTHSRPPRVWVSGKPGTRP